LEITKNKKKQYLGDYELEDKSTLFVICRVTGGNGPEPVQLKQFPEGIELTDAPDMITWDDDPENKRAKMPCGHAIGM